MSEFNENNNSNGIAEIASAEPATTEPAVEAASEVSFSEGPEIIGGVEAAKKNKSKIIAIIVAVVVLIFGCCAGAYAAIPQFKNTVKMLVNSPEEYYKWVENQNTENNVEFLSELLYGDVKEKMHDTNTKIKAELDSNGIDKLLQEKAGTTLAESGVTLPASFDMNIKGTSIDGYMAVNEEMSADGNSLIKLNAYYKDNKYYVQYPELSSSYLCVDYFDFIEKSLEGANLDYESDQDAQIFKSVVDTMTGKSDIEPIGRNDFEDLFNRYFKVMIDSVNNVDISKNTECEADGVKCEYTKLTVKFDQGTLFSALKGILKELQNDDVVAGLVEDISGISKDEYKSAVEQALKSIGGLEMSGGDTIFVMNVYVNSKGEVVGRNIEDADQSGEFSVGYICTNNSNNYGFSFYFEEDDDRVSLDGNAAESSGKLTGSAKISSTVPLEDDVTGAEIYDIIGVSFENLECGGEFLKGSLTVALGSFGLDDLTLNFDENDGNQTCNFDFTYEGTKIGSFTLESNNDTPDSITVFSDDAKVYDALTEMEQYSSEVDYEGFIKNICKAFGIDESLVPSEFADMDLVNSLGNKYATDEFDMDEDEFDDDFEHIEFEDYSVEYDLSKLKIQYNGSDIKLPGKVEGILDKVKFDPEKVEAKGYAYGYSDDYSISASIYNPSEKEAMAKDCNIYSLSINNETNEKLTIDGIGYGDDIQKTVDKFGCKLTDPKSGITKLEDSNNGFSNISFLYYDGKITGITLYYDTI